MWEGFWPLQRAEMDIRSLELEHGALESHLTRMLGTKRRTAAGAAKCIRCHLSSPMRHLNEGEMSSSSSRVCSAVVTPDFTITGLRSLALVSSVPFSLHMLSSGAQGRLSPVGTHSPLMLSPPGHIRLSGDTGGGQGKSGTGN